MKNEKIKRQKAEQLTWVTVAQPQISASSSENSIKSNLF
jgi:hypothetical protein